MGAQHGNVYIRNGPGTYRVVLQRDGTTVPVPWATELAYASNGTLIATVKTGSLGSLQLWDGLDIDMPLIASIPRPSLAGTGQIGSSHFTISPGGQIWLGFGSGIGSPRRIAMWDTNTGGPWVYFRPTLSFPGNPLPWFLYSNLDGAFYYCFGAGTSTGADLRAYDSSLDTDVVVWDPQAAIPAWDAGFTAPNANGTVWSVITDTGDPDTVLCTYNALIDSPTHTFSSQYSGIYVIDRTSGAIIDLLQLPGWAPRAHYTLVQDSEGDLWALGASSTTAEPNVKRFTSAGTVVDTWTPPVWLENYSLFPGPRLSPEPVEVTVHPGLYLGLHLGGGGLSLH